MAIGFRAAGLTRGFGSTTIAATKPTGTASGDVLIALVSFDGNTGVISPPSGWTQIALSSQSSPDSQRNGAWYRVCDGTEGATFTFTGQDTSSSLAVLLCYTGVDNTTPMDATATTTLVTTATTGPTVNPVNPSITTVTNNAWVVGFVSADEQFGKCSGWSGTIATGFTERADIGNNNGISLEWCYIYAEDQAFASAGATGTFSPTLSFADNSDGMGWWAITIALRPAGGGGAAALAGDSIATAASTGALSTGIQLVGAALAVAIATGGFGTQIQLVGAAAATATSTGALTTISQGNITFKNSAVSRGYGSTTLTATLPTGISAGDILLAIVAFDGTTGLIATPSGWTSIDKTMLTGPDGQENAAFYRICTGTEGSTVNFVGADASSAIAGLVLYSGVDTVTPLDNTPTKATNTSNNTSVVSVACPSITTLSANAMLVTMVSLDDTTGKTSQWTGAPAAGFNERIDAGNNNGLGLEWCYVHVSDKLQAASAASGVITEAYTYPTGADKAGWYALTLALRPLGTPASIGGPAVATATATGALTIGAGLAGAAVATATATGNLPVAAALAGAAVATATATGNILVPVPTLVQRVAHGALDPAQGISSLSFTVRMPNVVRSGNTIVLFVDCTATRTLTSITDNAGNTWPTTPTVQANPGGGMKTLCYVLPNAIGGTQALTVTFSTAENSVHFLFLEYTNLAGSPVGVTSTAAGVAAPSVAAPTFSPAQGSLVLHYAFQGVNTIGDVGTTSVTSWTAASGWALEAADFANGWSSGPRNMNPYALQTRMAPGGNLTPALTTSGTNSYNTVALELKGGISGTQPPAGARIRRMQFYTQMGGNQNPWVVPFPTSAANNSIVTAVELAGDMPSVPSDNRGNTWTLAVAGVVNSVAGFAWAKITNPGQDMRLSLPMNWGLVSDTFCVMEIVETDPTTPIAQTVTAPIVVVGSNPQHQPDITPINPNGLIVAMCGIETGPITGIVAPSGAQMFAVTYPGETDFDSFQNADGFGAIFYGPTTAQNWTWDYAGSGVHAYAIAFEVKSVAGLGSISGYATALASSTGALSSTIQLAGAAVATASSYASFGYVVPPDRKTTWIPGMTAVGGIPSAGWPIYLTLGPTGGDDTSAIQTAVNNCPANQVVKLAAGTFTISSTINLKPNMVLRGSGGPGTGAGGFGSATVIQGAQVYPSVGVTLIGMGPGVGGWTQITNLVADGVKETNTCTLATARSLRVGELVLVDQLTDSMTEWGYQDGGPGAANRGWFNRGPGSQGEAVGRPQGQMMEVASVNGTTVTFTTNFHITYKTSNTAQLCRLSVDNTGTGAVVSTDFKNCGVEDLRLTRGYGGDNGASVGMFWSQYCWIRNVESDNGFGSNFAISGCFRAEVRECYVHTTVDPNPGGGGYGLVFSWHTSDSLLENNISWNMNKVMNLRASGGGNVIGYNYMEDGWISFNPTFMETGLNACHSAGSLYELFEGNQCFNFDGDDTHGNANYITVFRNHLTGFRRAVPPLDSYTYNSAGSILVFEDDQNRRAVGLMTNHHYYTFLGNVLGTATMTIPPVRSQNTGGPSAFAYGTPVDALPGLNGMAAMWKLGWDYTFSQPADVTVYNTAIVDGNWDYFTNSVHWQNPPTSFPNSLYLSAKPSFFGAQQWPWVDSLGGTKTYQLPARVRFDTINPGVATGTNALQGSSVAVATGSGVLTTGIAVIGAAVATATATGSLSSSAQFSGQAVSQATATGVLTTVSRLASVATVAATATGNLSTSIRLTAALATATAVATGALATDIEMAADAFAQATATGSLASASLLGGQAIAQASSVAELETAILFAADAFAQAAAGARLDTAIQLVGLATVQALSTGDIFGGQTTLYGDAMAVARATGNLTISTTFEVGTVIVWPYYIQYI